MIHNFFPTLKEDSSILVKWLKKENIQNVDETDRKQRIQIAAARMIGALALISGTIWTFSIFTFVITLPLKAGLKLALAVNVFVLGHDLFVMSQNVEFFKFKKEGVKATLFDLILGLKKHEEMQARKLTHGTIYQPAWMWFYVNRKELKDKINNVKK